MRYGDELFTKEQFCDAVAQYENAQTIAALDKTANDNWYHAYSQCYPPTATIDLTATAAALTPSVPTDTPSSYP
jgi:hypothetical protein